MTTLLEKKFIKLYNNPQITTRKIRKQLNLEYNEFYRIRNQLLKQGKLKERKFKRTPKPKRVVKNYTRIGGYYQIKKNMVYYGSCKTIKQARRMVELLKECNWDINCKDEIKKQAIKEFPR